MQRKPTRRDMAILQQQRETAEREYGRSVRQRLEQEKLMLRISVGGVGAPLANPLASPVTAWKAGGGGDWD